MTDSKTCREKPLTRDEIEQLGLEPAPPGSGPSWEELAKRKQDGDKDGN